MQQDKRWIMQQDKRWIMQQDKRWIMQQDNMGIMQQVQKVDHQELVYAIKQSLDDDTEYLVDHAIAQARNHARRQKNHAS